SAADPNCPGCGCEAAPGVTRDRAERVLAEAPRLPGRRVEAARAAAHGAEVSSAIEEAHVADRMRRVGEHEQPRPPTDAGPGARRDPREHRAGGPPDDGLTERGVGKNGVARRAEVLRLLVVGGLDEQPVHTAM